METWKKKLVILALASVVLLGLVGFAHAQRDGRRDGPAYRSARPHHSYQQGHHPYPHRPHYSHQYHWRGPYHDHRHHARPYYRGYGRPYYYGPSYYGYYNPYYYSYSYTYPYYNYYSYYRPYCSIPFPFFLPPFSFFFCF